MSTLKEQMASMMDAMLGMRQLMENNVATAATVSLAAKADLTLPATAHHPLPNMVGRERSTLGHISNPHLGHNRVAYPYGLPLNYTPLVMRDDTGHVSSPILKGSFLDSWTRFTRIVESMPKETSISTPRSPSRGRHLTHYLGLTSRENLETSQHSQYSFSPKDHPLQQKKKGNSISSKRD